MSDQINKIEKLIYTCFKELSDHTMQAEVISPQIKAINENLKSITEYIDQIKQNSSLETSENYPQREVKSDDEKKELLKLAYALSKFDHVIINDILKSNYNQSAVFGYLSNKMKVKANTLKNYRDMFDPYIKNKRSNRKGWYQKQLSPEFRVIKELWDDKDYSFIKTEIINIIK